MIVLVGMPGCGKSTIGRLLARRLQLDFVDADQRIEQHLGCTIRSYFDSHGEEAFRDVEQNVLAQLLAGGAHGVLATGGGAVLRSANRALIRTAAQVFYLRATPDEIWRRVRHDTKRPLLQVANPLQRLRDLYAQRDPLYSAVADHVVDTGRSSVSSIAHLLAMQLELGAPAAAASDQNLHPGDATDSA